MNNNNEHVLDDICRWLQAGHSIWLGTVVKTWGSSPRPVGSLMAYVPGVGLSGSLSGGCIEEHLLVTLKEEGMQQRAPMLQSFGGESEQQGLFQLPCGGELLICLEYLRPVSNHIQHFQNILERVAQRESVARMVDLNNGQMSLTYEPESKQLQLDQFSLYHPLMPGWRMLLTGCGEVTRCVAELAKTLDFSVTVCDFRPDFVEGWSMDGVTLFTGFPDDLIQKKYSDHYSAVITLAHDPRVDDMALLAALDGDAFYVGAMGSTRTSDKRRQRLLQLDMTQQQIDKLHAPAGYSTGSKTPWEIAISIMAEVIAVRKQASINSRASNG